MHLVLVNVSAPEVHNYTSEKPVKNLGYRMVPKDNIDLSVSEAVYRSPLTFSGEFIMSPELHPFLFFAR